MEKLSDIYEYNRIAIAYLKSGNPEEAFTLIDKAEKTLKYRKVPTTHKLWGITFNNLGCYYRHIRKPQKALSCFEKATAYPAITDKDKVNMAGVFLNISSIKDQFGQHATSLSYAQKALHAMKNTLNKRKTRFSSCIRGKSRSPWAENRNYTPLRFASGYKLSPIIHTHKYTSKYKPKMIFSVKKTRFNIDIRERAAVAIQRAWRNHAMNMIVNQKVFKAQTKARDAILELDRLKKLTYNAESAMAAPLKFN